MPYPVGSDINDRNQVRVIVEASTNISELEITERDIKKIGRSASIYDRGISELLDNAIRRDVLRSFHHQFERSPADTGLDDAGGDRPPQVGRGPYGHADGGLPPNPPFVDAAFSIGRWSISRYRRFVSELRDSCIRFNPGNSLIQDLDNLQWAVVALESHKEHDNGDGDGSASALSSESSVDETAKEAERHVWVEYCSKVLGMKRDFAPAEISRSLKEAAIAHFKAQLGNDINELDMDDLVKSLYLLPYFKIGPMVFELWEAEVTKRIPADVLAGEVYPYLAVLIAMQIPSVPGTRGGHLSSVEFIEKLVSVAGDLFTEHAIGSFLELCAHTQKADCARAVVDAVGHKISSEIVVTALIPVCINGADHFIALLELFVMDRSMTAEIEKSADSKDAAKSKPKGKSETAVDFMKFVGKSAYLLIFLSAVAGYAKPATVQELIDFHSDPCSAYITELVESHHRFFIAHLFRNVCLLNFGNIAWMLIENKWVPPSIVVELDVATTLGNQGIVHMLMEALLLPDEKLGSSALPIIFRKSEALSVLPKIARRFPNEAAWFLEQISCVPLPSCVPKSRTAEPEIRSKPIQGIRLGSVSLKDAIYRRPKGGTGIQFWKRLSIAGQLHKAGNGKNEFETDSSLCIAPEALLTGTAYHNPLFGKSWSPVTSPFIRLLAEDNEEIILQPVMQALMEYHWARGHFWLRFALQFFMNVTYVACFATTSIAVVNYQYGGAPKPSYLYPLGSTVLALALFFIFQEVREFHDYPKKYLGSVLNILDSFIHLIAAYVVIATVFFSSSVPPIFMSLALVFSAFRIVIHLRVLPSVGPLVRLSMTAALSIMPILVPMALMAVGFAVSFFLLETETSWTLNIDAPHFDNLGKSLQSVLSMATTDYSVLDAATVPQIFLLRLLFHITFIIFLVNVIIALMTVNVADIQSNMTSAWLMEIAGMMVDLELFWPWPIRYSLESNVGGKVGNAKANRTREAKIHPMVTGADSFINNHRRPSVEANTTQFQSLLSSVHTVLYTWPRELVQQSAWWNILSIRAMEALDDSEDAFNVGLTDAASQAGSSFEDRGSFNRDPLVSDAEAAAPPFWRRLLAKVGLAREPVVPHISVVAQELNAFGEMEKIQPDDSNKQSREAAIVQRQRTTLMLPPNATGAMLRQPTGREGRVIQETAPPTVQRRRASLAAVAAVAAVTSAGTAAPKTDAEGPPPRPPSLIARSKTLPQNRESIRRTSVLTSNANRPVSASRDAQVFAPRPLATTWERGAEGATGPPDPRIQAIAAAEAETGSIATMFQLEELSLQLLAIQDSIRALEKSNRSEAKANRDRIKRLEDAIARSERSSQV